MKKIFIIFTVLSLITACEKKTEKSVFDGETNPTEVTANPEIVEEPAVFQASFDILTPQSAELQLFYTVDEDTGFNETNSKKVMVNGSQDFQTVEFGLPRHATSVRLDLGQNTANKNFSIKNVKFSANNYTYEIMENPLAQFSANEFIQMDTTTGQLTVKEINGKYDPFIVSKKSLNDQLQDSLR